MPNRKPTTPASSLSLGLCHIIEELDLQVPLPAVRSSVGKARKTHSATFTVDEQYPKHFAAEGLFGNLKFAMRYEPLDLGVLHAAFQQLEPEVVEQIIEGMARACSEGGCALLGGETAEMPGFYPDGEYDIAGFIVGMVDRRKVINGSRIVAGDVVFGLPAVGLHTNGYSLARKLLLDVAGYQIDTHVEELGCTVGAELLKHHKSYLPALDRLIGQEGIIKGLAHITGGGLVENIPRILPINVDVALHDGRWPVLPVYDLMRRIGNVPEAEMLRTFNMGLGMIVITGKQFADYVKDQISQTGETVYQVGEVIDGDGKVVFV